MEAPKPTPGPWTQKGFAVFSPKDELLFHTGFGLLPISRGREAEANAKLIAAAPMLLVASKSAAKLSHKSPIAEFIKTKALLRAAIAKAIT